jgi:hypothetical protein
MTRGLGVNMTIATEPPLVWMFKTGIADPLCIGGR